MLLGDAASPRPPMSAELRRVLVVEDDDAIANLLLDTLADEGVFDARRARDGREALDVLAAWRPDVILLDMMMPGMDGWDFREEQQRLDVATDVPVVVLSASRRIANLDPQFAAAAVIAKPFDLDNLLEVVDQLTAGALP